MLNKILSGFVFLCMAVIVLSFSLVSIAEAATCTAEDTSNWDNTLAWDAACNGDTIPDADDDVIIPANISVTVNEPGAVAGSVTFSDPVGVGANIITFAPGGTLDVTGAIIFEGSSGASSSTINLATGTLSAGSIAIAGGGSTGNSIITISTGTITTTGDIAFSGTAARAQLTSTGASNINVGGDFTSGGTFTRGSSTVTFDGSGAQGIGAYSYTDVVIDKSAGTATLLGDTLILNELLVSSGTFDSSTYDLDITFPTTISSGATLTHGTGNKIQNGDLLVEEGGTWTEAGAATVEFLGHVTNNGTFTANTGLHTFANFTRTINGTLSIPSVYFNTNAVYTNNGTLTISTALSGDGELINGAGATLNIGDDVVDNAGEGLTFTASAAGNTVNYNRAGDQTVKVPTGADYDNLTLSGSGTKTIGSGITIAGDAYISDGVIAALTGDSTSNRLYLDDELQVAGSWGSTSSAADDQNNNYFSGTGTLTAANGMGVITTTSGGARRVRPATVAVPGTVSPTDCLPGYLFSPSTGRNCNAATPALPSVGNGGGYAFGQTLIKQGSTGEACKAWQMFFNDKFGANLVVDGMCGRLTIAAAKAWQMSVGLAADGALGPLSRGKAMMQY